MSCTACGATITAGAKFCPECGTTAPAASHSAGHSAGHSGHKPTTPVSSAAAVKKYSDSELAERVKKALSSHVCTYAFTERSPARQKWWFCNTCVASAKLGENTGICETCSTECHKGHDIVYGGESTFFCECGYLGCHATQIKSESKGREIGKGGGGGGGAKKIPEAKDARSKIPGLMDVEPKTKPLQAENVFLDTYTYQNDEEGTLRMQWVLRNGQHFNPMSITFDYSKCKGVKYHIKDPSSVVRPMEMALVADVENDPEQACSIGVSYTYKLLPPDERALAEEKKKQAEESERAAKALVGITSASSLEAIIKACTSAGVKYVDKEFPASNSSLYSGSNPLPYKEVVWRRPEEFFDGKPYQLYEGIEPTDINQGALGNCWFCCAVSALAEFPNYIRRIFENKASNPAGVYRLRLYNETDVEPVNVTLDDLFPCKPGAGPIFTSNKQEELWAMLLEKAYAKNG